MKNLLPFLLLAFFVINGYSQNKNFSRWSIWGEYGYNYLDGDVNQNRGELFPSSTRESTYGGGIGYAFTPVWGLSADYAHFPLKANNTIPASIEINTIVYSGSLNATINFTSLIFPNTNSKFIMGGSLGVGFAYYEFDPIDLATGVTPVNALRDSQGRQVSRAGVVPVTFIFEYNFSKPFSVGAKVRYQAFTKDDLEGVANLNWKGVTNDYVASAGLYVRYKFMSIKRDHLRNISYLEYAPDGMSVALEAKNEIAALRAKVENVDKKVDDLATKVNNMTPHIENLEKFISNDGPDTDKDGVPDVRDQEPNTPPNTPVDFWGRALKAVTVNGNKNTTNISTTEIPTVYFDYDSYQLDNDALIAISKVAMSMLSDTTLMLEVNGRTDFSGDEKYNLALSLKRAVRVKDELIKVWEIAPDRIIASGGGRVEAPKVIYKPSRRCEFYFSK